jgi:hypothetical protein
MFTICLIGTLIGFLSYDYLDNYMITGIKGVEYYSEAHLTYLNIFVHTVCMPYTIYGMLYCLSSIIFLNETYAKQFSHLLYFIYGGHYYKINLVGSLCYYIMYYPVIYLFNCNYKYELIILDTLKKKKIISLPSFFYLFKKGLIISCISLTIQECIGHYIGGDIASRPDGVANAILYSMYFSSTKIINIVN